MLKEATPAALAPKKFRRDMWKDNDAFMICFGLINSGFIKPLFDDQATQNRPDTQ